MTPHFRAIDVSGQPALEPADQAAPVLDWIPIRQLVVDDRYQRPLTRAGWQTIRRIAENFRWSRFSPVLVAPMPGALWAIIDGQHRTHAAAICGHDKVPCMSVHMDTAEQAQAFADVNGTVTRITVHHVFKAALAAGENWADGTNWITAQADRFAIVNGPGPNAARTVPFYVQGGTVYMDKAVVKHGDIGTLQLEDGAATMTWSAESQALSIIATYPMRLLIMANCRIMGTSSTHTTVYRMRRNGAAIKSIAFSVSQYTNSFSTSHMFNVSAGTHNFSFDYTREGSGTATQVENPSIAIFGGYR
ncbi:ParB N-terminal domain-containing protein [Paracoccus sp. DMF-8]|uniref:phage tail tip fiber protein n=1 Tax=Paracoccus sp. DMF-8 TaxID=3019445 RepID=UPI0023E38246|nr:ParB N-terminal domain-containing protein [Paracoccus sp. DMF-8]MDF3607736.1 ParB N-terminal domain-containing protein [Paracoccus sp. DMF-8]